jgi:glycosyltransferase involved in cell wall biosynthesis/tetratricopeptide (TPR) repeat protein
MLTPAASATATAAARQLLEQRRYGEAIALARSLSAKTGDPRIYLIFGDLCADLDDHEHARTFWRVTAARAASGSVRSAAHRRLAREASRRGRPTDAAHHLEQVLADQPGDRRSLVRLLGLRCAGLQGPERQVAMWELQATYPAATDPLLEAVFVLPFIDVARALATLTENFKAMLAERELCVSAVDAFIEAGHPREGLLLADRLATSEGAGEKELNCVLRAEKAAGGGPEAALSRIESHLETHPQDGRSRLKRAKLSLQLRRWQEAHADAAMILAAEPSNLRAAELAILALVRLDRPIEARALRDTMVAADGERGGARAAELARLDLALADGQLAMERQAQAEVGESEHIAVSMSRIDALMAVGRYQAALEAIASVTPHSDSVELRVKGIRCAAALSHPEGDRYPFPEATFRAGIGLRRLAPAPYRSVVLVTSTLGAGGAERQVALSAAGLVEPLRRHGLETHLVCRDLRPTYQNHLMLPMVEGSGATVTDLSIFDPGAVVRALRASGALSAADLRLLSSFPLPEYRSIALLLDQFRRLRPEVVHLWQDGIICVGSVAAMMAGVPRVVCSIRNVVPGPGDTRRFRPYLQGVYQALAANPRVQLTANSRLGARDYETKLGLPEGLVGVIRNGLDLRALSERCGPDGRDRVRSELGFGEDALVLGAVFRLVPAKRPHLWLEVAAALSRQFPTLRLLLIGEGPLRAELEGLARDLGIGERTIFAGRRAPVEPWIAAMDTMLLSSDVEGLPNVLIEAQALGVPVVTTDAGGAREAVSDGVTGRVVADSSPSALVEACASYLASPERRALARARGPGFVAETFGLDRMIGETLGVLGYGGRAERLAAE